MVLLIPGRVSLGGDDLGVASREKLVEQWHRRQLRADRVDAVECRDLVGSDAAIAGGSVDKQERGFRVEAHDAHARLKAVPPDARNESTTNTSEQRAASSSTDNEKCGSGWTLSANYS